MNREELQKKKSENNKMVITTYHIKIILNINGVNASIKRHRVAEWKKKKKVPCIRCLQDTYLRSKDTQAENKEWKKIFHGNGLRGAGVAILYQIK